MNEEQVTCSHCNPCCGKTKKRTDEEFKSLMNRLNRVEGQIHGIKGMLENDAYCTDILVQVSAATAALNSFNKELLANHIKTCVTEHIKSGDDSVVDELVQTLQKLMK
ncbi:MAG: metal-sensing transcriptional repressor [Treponemataceae bacterium]|nr:metal-sensing transcriptional repressor [Treponemataceae bacterium]